MPSWIRLGSAGALVAASLWSVLAQTARAEDPIFVAWSALLPGLSDDFDPSSENACVAGKPQCIASAIKEMERRFEPLGRSCHHNAIFALSYLRTTQTFEWASAQDGYFDDTAWVNHEAAVFAKYYFEAYDSWAAGRTQETPRAWLIAFEAAAARRVSGSGDLMLGMNAHINRDLPLTLGAIGIATTDGDSRKPDHDKVNEFLNKVTQPLLAELSARFSSDVLNIVTPFGVGYTGLFLQVQAWRERAFRSAELLNQAPSEQARALIVQTIESDAALEATQIVATYGYLPPLTSTTARDSYCSRNQAAPAPMSYAFGTVDSY